MRWNSSSDTSLFYSRHPSPDKEIEINQLNQENIAVYFLLTLKYYLNLEDTPPLKLHKHTYVHKYEQI